MIPVLDVQQKSPPLFNLPRILSIHAVVLIVLFLPQVMGLKGLANFLFDNFAFVPLRYHGKIYLDDNIFSTIFSPIGYSFLHVDWVHLLVNLGMMIAFGKVVVVVCGPRVFCVLYVLGALAGSSAVLVLTEYPQYPLIGASAAISAFVGAVGCLGVMQQHRMPPPFDQRRRSIQFLCIWFGLNILMALLPHAAFASSFAIAWQAHLAGLFVGYIYAYWGLRGFALHSTEDDDSSDKD